MIRLYREETCLQADAIEAEFKEMVIGYERVMLEPQQAGEMFGGRTLPVIANNEKVVSGEEEKPFLEELERLRRDWYLLQGSTCYVDGDGTTSCS